VNAQTTPDPAPGTPAARARALQLMRAFAARTGLDGDAPPRRYLWTDAFAVCNFLALGERAAAARLVAQVHAVLGRHRGDDGRDGTLSGMAGAGAARHPTAGGLRIGKPLPERGPGEPPDPQREWDRDGQYFHYLTRWMHALDQYARAAVRPEANRWARELARVAHRAFVRPPSDDAPRMAWKMSIALDRPLVDAMGQHDPLDGLVTYLQLRAHRVLADGPGLEEEVADMAGIVAGTRLRTDDPLGLGGLLGDAWRLAQLLHERAGDNALFALVLSAAAAGLEACLRERPFARPAEQRLAFRELGLAIGLQAVPRTWRALGHDGAGAAAGQEADRVDPAMAALLRQVPLARRLAAYWADPARRGEPGWRAHEDINEVMLATALLPEGYLDFA